MSRKLVTSVLITVLGIGLVLVGGYTIYETHEATSSAEEVDAVVVDSHVDDIRNREDEDNRYVPEVTYEYEYDGEEHTSDNVYPGWHEPGITEEEARLIVADHEEGETVTAYVNPDDPADSYLLERSVLVQREALGAIVAGAIILILMALNVGSRILGVELPFSGIGDERSEKP
ncbi:MAG: DUF3592 domain-containing protein [Halobacteriota archaeon]